MKSTMWFAGECTAAVSPTGVIVMAPGHDELVTHMWELLGEGTDFVSLFSALTERFPGDFPTIPPFVILVREGEDGHFAVRGDFRLTLRSGEDVRVFDGTNLVTWSEGFAAPLDAFEIQRMTAEHLPDTPSGSARDAVLQVGKLVSGQVEVSVPLVEDTPVEQSLPAEEVSASTGVDESTLTEKTEAEEILEETSTPVERTNSLSAPIPLHQSQSAPVEEEPVHETTQDVVSEDTEGVEVLAAMCVEGHPNPPFIDACRTCAGPLSQNYARIIRPPLGHLVLPSGERILLDKDVIIGRSPGDPLRRSRQGARLINIEDSAQEISRSHCEIRVDGWDARLRDLGSQNGTYLTHEGQGKEQVGTVSALILRHGDVIELGNTVSIRLEA